MNKRFIIRSKKADTPITKVFVPVDNLSAGLSFHTSGNKVALFSKLEMDIIYYRFEICYISNISRYYTVNKHNE